MKIITGPVKNAVSLMHPLLQQHTQLIEQAFHAYERGSYESISLNDAMNDLLRGI